MFVYRRSTIIAISLPYSPLGLTQLFLEPSTSSYAALKPSSPLCDQPHSVL